MLAYVFMFCSKDYSSCFTSIGILTSGNVVTSPPLKDFTKMSSQYHHELSVNNLLSPPPPPPPPPTLDPQRNAKIRPSINYHRNDMSYERETSEYYGGDQCFSNHKSQHWQHRPSPPFSATPYNTYNNQNLRERPPRPQFRPPIAKPTGLRGPWLANKPEIDARKRPMPDSSCDDQKNATLPLLMEALEKLPSEDGPKEPSKVSAASLSPVDVSVGNCEAVETVQLPIELTVLFGPLKCDLCSVEVNSVLQAKMHYSGKIHEKKVGQYMQKWSNEKGEPVPKRFRQGAPKNMTGMTESDLYCEVCDLALTSSQHADQHYGGRNHQRAMLGNAPLKAGYFNKTLGKWQRMPVVEPDASGRFHIGKGFVASAASTDPLGLKQTLVVEPKASPLLSPFSCQLCQINTTSNDQLETHYKGAKHKKAMKNAGDSWSVERQKIPAPVAPLDSILASLVPKEEVRNFVPKSPTLVKRDMSIYRTPSGQYYCQPCNLTLNSEAQFTQHCDTKKHKVCAATVKKPSR